MNHLCKKIFVVCLAFFLAFSGINTPAFAQAKTAAKTVTSLSLNKTKITLTVGKTYKLKATVKPSNSSNKKLTYKSSNKKVATVTQTGKIKAISKGSAVIKVKTANGITKRCNVTVIARASDSSSTSSDSLNPSDENDNTIDSIYLEDYETSMLVNTFQTLIVNVWPEDADKSNLVYSSSDKSVAVVSPTGVITALKAGTTSIIISCKGKSSINDSFQLTVLDNPSLTIGSSTIHLGDSSETVLSTLGAPGRMDQSYYGDTAYVYNGDYTHFTIIYMQASQVVGFYSDAIDFQCQGIRYNASISSNQASYYDSCYQLNYYIDGIGTGLVNGVKLISNTASIGNLSASLYAMEIQAFDLTNSLRARNSIPLLTWNDTAAECARMHSQDMALNNYFSHTDLSGQSSSDRMTLAGINWRGCGENISAGYGDSTDTVFGWYQSEGHRKNMLNSSYTHLGVGAAIGGSYGNYYTQNFYY